MVVKFTLIAYFVCAVATLLTACDTHRGEGATASNDDPTSVMARQIRQCSRLYTIEYKVHKIVSVSDRSTIDAKGLGLDLELEKPGHRKMVVPIDATLKGYIDFAQFNENNIKRQGDHLIITLPDPGVTLTGSKVDQEHLREFVSPYRDRFSSEEKNELIALGRQAVIDEIPRLGIEQGARTAAVRLLMPILTRLGFEEENITINFRSDFSNDQLIRHLD